MKITILLFSFLVCLRMAASPVIEPDEILKVLSNIGNTGPITSQRSILLAGANTAGIEVTTPTGKVEIFPSQGELQRIYYWKKPALEKLDWSTEVASTVANKLITKLTGERITVAPDYITQEEWLGTHGVWSVEWTRRIGEFKVTADFTKIIFDESGTIYCYLKKNSLREDMDTSQALLSREEAVSCALKFAAHVIKDNSERFRGYKIGAIVSAEKALITPMEGWTEDSIMRHKHDPENVRPTWMVLWANVHDPDYKGVTLAVPESKLMIWVDAETGEYCGANF